MKLYLYNTLSRKKELFKPIDKKEVHMYSCGPTVYWYATIGNMRTYIFSDILKRTLLYNKYKLKNIINVTDVGHLTSDADEGEDKMEKAAKKEGKSAKEIANHYLRAFQSDMVKLNILNPSKWTKATEHIKEQIELIKILEKKGYTYRTKDGIYFDTSKMKDYGKIANIQKEKIQAGKRVEMGEKRNSTDFALWKFSTKQEERQQEWKSPWDIGFPGWHIECSAMSMKYFGATFDIHTGGEDHLQVHHPNEIAQSESATGKQFVKYWLHGAFLVDKDGKKVSKSTGGLYTVSELQNIGYDPLHYRYLCLQTHYRKPLHFSIETLDAAKNAYERLKRKVIELRQAKHKGEDKTKKYISEFTDAINDDLNTPAALQVVIKALDDITFYSIKKIKFLENVDKVLGLKIEEMQEEKLTVPKELKNLINAREEARKSQNWAEADILRQRIKEAGYTITDTAQGPKLEKIY